jgi:hypothetical protein
MARAYRNGVNMPCNISSRAAMIPNLKFVGSRSSSGTPNVKAARAYNAERKSSKAFELRWIFSPCVLALGY